jgi:hypothetical protein
MPIDFFLSGEEEEERRERGGLRNVLKKVPGY